MTITENTNRLHAQLATMIDLETAIEGKLKELTPFVPEYAGARALLTEYQSLPGEHRQALETRLNKITDPVSPTGGNTNRFPSEGLAEGTYNGASTALQIVSSMFNQALVGYSVLRVYATRFLDSPYIQEEDTSMALADRFIKNYGQALQQIYRTLHDVVLWELDRDGFECQCICPACSVGICLCSIAGRGELDDAWQEAGQFYEAAPIYVQRPKQNSPAAQAGLQRGQIITAAEGQELETWFDLFKLLKNANSGDEIQLKIRQGAGALDEITLVHP